MRKTILLIVVASLVLVGAYFLPKIGPQPEDKTGGLTATSVIVTSNISTEKLTDAGYIKDRNSDDVCQTELEICQRKYIELRERFIELQKQKVREVEVIKEVPVEVIVEVPKVEIREVFKPLDDFGSEKELREFLYGNRDNIEVKIINGEDGKAQLSGCCVAIAKAWRDYAASLGKNLEIEDITNTEYQVWFGRNLNGEGHIILLALVEGWKIYYVEPSTLEMHWIGYVQ